MEVAPPIGFLERSDAKRRGGLWAAVVFVVAALLVPVATLVPLIHTSSQRGLLAGTREVCSAIGDQAAVVIVDLRTSLPATYSQTIRGMCDVPVAIASEDATDADVFDMAGAWEAFGRTLWVVTGDEEADVPVQLQTLAEVDYRLLARTLHRPPSGWEGGSLTVLGAPIAPSPTGGG